MSNQWDSCRSMSVPRNRVGVGVIDNEMYAVGGSKGTDHQNTVEKFLCFTILLLLWNCNYKLLLRIVYSEDVVNILFN